MLVGVSVVGVSPPVVVDVPSDPVVAEHAFDFYKLWQPAEAERVIKAALTLDDGRWSAHVRAACLFAQNECYPAAADHYERALDLMRPPTDRFEGEAALAAYLAGRPERAKELADRALEFRGFNIDVNFHLGQTVIGLLAVDAGEIEAAESALRSACVTSLPASGPSFRLARRLLREGRVDGVKKYLQHIGGVWRQGSERCRAWLSDLEAGGLPEMANPGR